MKFMKVYLLAFVAACSPVQDSSVLGNQPNCEDCYSLDADQRDVLAFLTQALADTQIVFQAYNYKTKGNGKIMVGGMGGGSSNSYKIKSILSKADSNNECLFSGKHKNPADKLKDEYRRDYVVKGDTCPVEVQSNLRRTQTPISRASRFDLTYTSKNKLKKIIDVVSVNYVGEGREDFDYVDNDFFAIKGTTRLAGNLNSKKYGYVPFLEESVIEGVLRKGSKGVPERFIDWDKLKLIDGVNVPKFPPEEKEPARKRQNGVRTVRTNEFVIDGRKFQIVARSFVSDDGKNTKQDFFANEIKISKQEYKRLMKGLRLTKDLN